MRLGIDFGTTRTVVAAVDRGNYPVLPFETPDGAISDWFPSLIAVRGAARLYGWDAYSRQSDPEWTVIRSIKRVLEGAGPNTEIELGSQHIGLLELLRELAGALRAQLPPEKLEAMLGVPANANANQRFLTAEAFRAAGFEVVGLLNEPSAASIEYGHKARPDGKILVYDLGGGTFDASLVQVDERTHEVIASEGISTLGGDDFDDLLAELAVSAPVLAALSQSELFRLREECRRQKETLHPNTRKIVLDLDHVREGWGAATVPVADFYQACRPLLDETVHLVEDLLAQHGSPELEALYVTGGGSEMPLVSRVLRETFGKRVKRSAYTRSATAIGLAIQADSGAEYVLRDRFTRYFGVWREGDAGARMTFDPLFAKGTPLPAAGQPALAIERRYHPVHNIGHFRYLECSQLRADGQPAGDITLWDDIVFPFEPGTEDSATVYRSELAAKQHILEKYECDAGGSVAVTISNDTAAYARQYRLGRWAARDQPVTPGKKARTTSGAARRKASQAPSEG